MKNINRGSLIAGIGLILLGALFIVFNLLPDFTIKQSWPMILIVAGFGFCLPALAWPESRKGLAALFIPGAFALALLTPIGPVAMYGIVKLTDIVKWYVARRWLRKERWLRNLAAPADGAAGTAAADAAG